MPRCQQHTTYDITIPTTLFHADSNVKPRQNTRWVEIYWHVLRTDSNDLLFDEEMLQIAYCCSVASVNLEYISDNVVVM